MKISKKQLQRLINEELNAALRRRSRARRLSEMSGVDADPVDWGTISDLAHAAVDGDSNARWQLDRILEKSGKFDVSPDGYDGTIQQTLAHACSGIISIDDLMFELEEWYEAYERIMLGR